MSDYSKGKIYKLYNEDEPDKVYVGSTVMKLSKRFKCHRKINKVNRCISKQLFLIGIPKIELIENYPCNTFKELLIRERYYIEQYSKSINIRIPILTDDEKQEYQKKWQDTNKEYLKEYQKEYQKKWQDTNKEYQKEYRKKQKENKIDLPHPPKN